MPALACHTHWRAGGEYGVEMRADDDGSHVGITVARGEHVPDVVHAHCVETEAAEPLCDGGASRLFISRWRRNLGERNLRGQQALVGCGEARARKPEAHEQRSELAAGRLGARTHTLSMAAGQPVAQDAPRRPA